MQASFKYYQQFSFRPDVSKSQAVVGRSNLSRSGSAKSLKNGDHNVSESEPHNRHKITAKELVELEFKHNCTFKPHVSDVSNQIVANMRSAASASSAFEVAGKSFFLQVTFFCAFLLLNKFILEE